MMAAVLGGRPATRTARKQRRPSPLHDRVPLGSRPSHRGGGIGEGRACIARGELEQHDGIPRYGPQAVVAPGLRGVVDALPPSHRAGGNATSGFVCDVAPSRGTVPPVRADAKTTTSFRGC